MVITVETELQAMRDLFFRLTGYGEHDLLVFNPGTRIFMTRNGGQYKLSASGRIEWIKGPSWEADERI